MGRILHTLLVGLVGAGIVHIAVLFLIPAMAPSGAWTRLAAMGGLYEPVRLEPEVAQELFYLADPLLRIGVCRFDLDDGIVRIAASGDVPYWSMSVYDRQGHNIFSINDSATDNRRLEFLIATPEQTAAVRSAAPADLGQAVFVETPIGEGIAAVRVLQPDETWEPLVAAFLENLGCAVSEGLISPQ